ncbi:MAG: hypothetical protein ACRDQ7_20425 [Haloechinothrix sp.]
MDLLTEQVAAVRLREREELEAARRPEVEEAIREHKARRRAYRWARLSRWAARKAERALNS